MTTETKIFRLEEVKKHNSVKSSWVVIHNKVYDITKFLEDVSFIFTYMLNYVFKSNVKFRTFVICIL